MINALKSGGLPFLLPMLLLSFGLFVVPFGVLAAYSLLAGDAPGPLATMGRQVSRGLRAVSGPGAPWCPGLP